MRASKSVRLGICMGLLTLASYSAFGQNALFLRNSPLAELSGKELDSLLMSVNTLLDSEQVNSPVVWTNESNDINAEMTVIAVYEKNNLRCRVLDIQTTRASAQSATQYRFCRVDDKWLIDSE